MKLHSEMDVCFNKQSTIADEIHGMKKIKTVTICAIEKKSQGTISTRVVQKSSELVGVKSSFYMKFIGL